MQYENTEADRSETEGPTNFVKHDGIHGKRRPPHKQIRAATSHRFSSSIAVSSESGEKSSKTAEKVDADQRHATHSTRLGGSRRAHVRHPCWSWSSDLPTNTSGKYWQPWQGSLVSLSEDEQGRHAAIRPPHQSEETWKDVCRLLWKRKAD